MSDRPVLQLGIASMCCALILSTAPAASAQHIDARGLLSDARRAISKIQSAEYEIVLSRTGPRGREFELSGVVQIVFSGDDLRNSRFRLTTSHGYTYAYGQDTSWFHDADGDSVQIIGLGPDALDQIRGNLVSQMVDTYLHWGDKPIGASDTGVLSVQYQGVGSLEGLTCHIVELHFPDTEYSKNIVSSWWIPLEDLIPRRETMCLDYGGERYCDTIGIRLLYVNHELNVDDLRISGLGPVTLNLPAAKRTTMPLEAGQVAPSWRLMDGDSVMRSSEEYRGRILIVDFWYAQCPPCLGTMAALERIKQRQDTNEVAVVGIHVKEKDVDPREIMRRRKLTYEVMRHGDSVAEEYRVTAYPTLFVIDRDGKIVFVSEGHYDDLERDIELAILRAKTQ